jgi:DNA replication protein DnaC
MDSKTARSDCVHCAGEGFVRDSEHTLAMCRCVLAAHRIPAGLRAVTLASFETGSDPVNENAKAVVGRLVEHAHRIAASPLVLGIAGEHGSGKTTLAVAILNELFYEGAIESAMIETAATLLDASDAKAQRALLERAKRADVLVIDDLGGEWAEHPRKAAAQLTALLDARLAAGRPTLFTTSVLDPAEWSARYEIGGFAAFGAKLRQHSLRAPLLVRRVARAGQGELAALLAA